MKQCASSAALLLGCGLAHAAVVNGGFESGTGTNADNWNQIEVFGGAQGAMASVDRSTMMPRTGTHAMDFSVIGAPDFGPVAEIQQQTAVGSVVGGGLYDFSFWAKGTPGPGSVAFYEILWFDGDGSNGGGPQGSATGLQAFGYGAAYAEVGMLNLLAPAGADSALIQIRLVTGAFDGAAGQMTVDDVSFAFVPAPGTIALAGLALLGAGRRRR